MVKQQCIEHWVKHQDLFDEQSDVVVTRTTDTFCKDEASLPGVIFVSIREFL